MGRLLHNSYDKTWGTINWHDPKQDHLNLVKSLYAQGAPINATDSNNSSVLLRAIETHTPKWEEIALFLIENGANINFADSEGETALIKACRRKDGLNVVKALVKRGAKISHRSKAINPSRRRSIPSTFALKSAAACGNADIVDFLIASGADARQKDSDGYESILYLGKDSPNNFEITKSLVHAGANVNCQDWAGDTPLMHAAGRNDLNSFEFLLDSNADIHKVSKSFSYDYNQNLDFIDVQAETALSVAISWGHEKIVESALNHGAKVDAIAKKTFTELYNRPNVSESIKKNISNLLFNSVKQDRLSKVEERKDALNEKTSASSSEKQAEQIFKAVDRKTRSLKTSEDVKAAFEKWKQEHQANQGQ